MREYDGLFIVDAASSKEGSKEAVQWLSDSISKQGGQIEALNEWGRRRLAYPVKKRYEAFYVQIDFKLKPEALANLENQYRLNDEILKFMVLLRPKGSKPYVPYRKAEGEAGAAEFESRRAAY